MLLTRRAPGPKRPSIGPSIPSLQRVRPAMTVCQLTFAVLMRRRLLLFTGLSVADGRQHLAGEVDHCKGHEGGGFESSKAAGASAVALRSALLSTKPPCSSCSSSHVMLGFAPGLSPGQTHLRQAVRPGAAQDDLATAVLSCRPRRRRRYRLGRCSTQASTCTRGLWTHAVGVLVIHVGVLVHVVCIKRHTSAPYHGRGVSVPWQNTPRSGSRPNSYILQ